MNVKNPPEWTVFLTELGRRHGVVIQVARVFGKRWAYVAGPTAAEAGLLGRTQIDLGEARVPACDCRDPAQGFLLAVTQIIDHEDPVARLQQLHAGMTADIARATRHQDPHRNNSPIIQGPIRNPLSPSLTPKPDRAMIAA